jgi:hypothetical protein
MKLNEGKRVYIYHMNSNDYFDQFRTSKETLKKRF